MFHHFIFFFIYFNKQQKRRWDKEKNRQESINILVLSEQTDFSVTALSFLNILLKQRRAKKKDQEEEEEEEEEGIGVGGRRKTFKIKKIFFFLQTTKNERKNGISEFTTSNGSSKTFVSN